MVNKCIVKFIFGSFIFSSTLLLGVSNDPIEWMAADGYHFAESDRYTNEEFCEAQCRLEAPDQGEFKDPIARCEDDGGKPLFDTPSRVIPSDMFDDSFQCECESTFFCIF